MSSTVKLATAPMALICCTSAHSKIAHERSSTSTAVTKCIGSGQGHGDYSESTMSPIILQPLSPIDLSGFFVLSTVPS